MADPTHSESNEFRVEKLNNDYATWAVLFQASLEDKELWEAIADPQPNAEVDAAGAAAWAKKDWRAFGRLKMSVALHHLPSVQACTSAKAGWDALKEAFTTKNNARRLQLTQEFALLKMKPGETLLGYSGRTKKLQLEMAATGHPYDDNSVLIHFLNGLPDEYNMEKKMLVHQGQDTPLRWDAEMPMLYPVETETTLATAAKEGPSVGGWSAGTVASRATTRGSARRVAPTARRVLAVHRPALWPLPTDNTAGPCPTCPPTRSSPRLSTPIRCRSRLCRLIPPLWSAPAPVVHLRARRG